MAAQWTEHGTGPRTASSCSSTAPNEPIIPHAFPATASLFWNTPSLLRLLDLIFRCWLEGTGGVDSISRVSSSAMPISPAVSYQAVAENRPALGTPVGQLILPANTKRQKRCLPQPHSESEGYLRPVSPCSEPEGPRMICSRI